MCGIVGLISKTPLKLSNNLYSANQQMYRRGPDDEGYVFFDQNSIYPAYGKDTPLDFFIDELEYYPQYSIEQLSNHQFKVGLGHRRLSIVDLTSHGHQPMSIMNQRYWIVFNGEIYNFREIKDELITYGYSFASNSDTEVILYSYLHWGRECLQKFNGMFAFAIYDQVTDEMFLARDRVGIKPLYYTIQNNVFIFASDIKTIIASELYHTELDEEGLYHNFSFSMTPRPKTMFKNIRALEQGHFMILNCKELSFTIDEYWDIPTNRQNNNMKEEDAIELLEEELKKAIEYRLIADVNVGTFMSGGIDSTTISAMASQLHPGIKAFTLGFDKSFSLYDEIEEAKATAKMYDMEHIVSFLDADVILDNIENMVLAYEEPYFHLAANYAISEIVKNNDVKVVLNGLGGDELFSGYSFYGRMNQWKKLSKFSCLEQLIPPCSSKLRTAKKLLSAKDIYQYYALSYSTLSDSEKSKLFKHCYHSIDQIAKRYKKESKEFANDFEILNYLDIKSYIGNHHVHRTDQFTMHFSIEGRFPFLDHNLIEAAFTIPSKYKYNNGIPKYVLRKVAEKYIAPECLSMTKKGFGLPLEYWFNNQLKELVESSVTSLKKRDILNTRGIEKLMSKGTISQKWHLVMFELWYQKFMEKRSIG